VGWGDSKFDSEFEDDVGAGGAGAKKWDVCFCVDSFEIGLSSCEVLFVYFVKEKIPIEFNQNEKL
jgi:hypothetical protein